LSDVIATSIVDIGQINIEELIRDVEKEKATRLLKQILENNVMLLNLQRKDRKKKKKEKRKERG